MMYSSGASEAARGQNFLAEGWGPNSTSFSGTHTQRTAIVGNWPISEEQRTAVDAADVVVRFNSMHSWCVLAP